MVKIEDFPFDDVLGCRSFLEYFVIPSGKLQLPSKAVIELKELLNNNDITNIQEYKELLKKILESQYLWRWQLRLFFLQNGVMQLLFIAILCLIFSYICIRVPIISNYIKKFINLLFKFTKSLLYNIIAALGYLFAYYEVTRSCAFYLVGKYPFMEYFFPDYFLGITSWISGAMFSRFYMMLYYLLIYVFCMRLRLPKKHRFIRFHWVYGLLLDQIINLYLPIYQEIIKELAKDGLTNYVTLCAASSLFLLFYLLFPPIIYALIGKYPKNEIVRDSIEIILGRDDDPNFKWWNRKK